MVDRTSLVAVSDGDMLSSGYFNGILAASGFLGEIRQIALSYTGAISLATMISYGWAVCDGTTPASQGVATPTITTTPNLSARFLYGHATTSGTTGGSSTTNIEHTHTVTTGTVGNHAAGSGNPEAEGNHTFTSSGASLTSVSIIPPYYTVVFFMKVRM